MDLSEYISNLPNKQIKYFNCLPFGIIRQCNFNVAIVNTKSVIIFSDIDISFQDSLLAVIIGY